MFQKRTILHFAILTGCIFQVSPLRAQCPAGNTVTVTNNSGANVNGSLVWAVNCLNTTPPLTTLNFNLAGSTQIQPSTALNVSKAGALITATAAQDIVIDGSSPAGAPPNGLVLIAPNITVEGLTIQNFTMAGSGNGILANGNNPTIRNNTLISNRIGINTGSTVSTFTITNNEVGVSGSGNTAGGISISTATAGLISFNEIAHNGGPGISILNGTVLIRENSIYCNTGSGITRPTPPIPPDITLANTQLVRGTVGSAATIEVFVHSNTGCSAAPCQGKTFVGSVTTAAAGTWTLNVPAGSVPANAQVTATSTVTNNNTSAFAACESAVDCSTLNASINQTNVSCFGLTNGSATALPSGSTFTYAWNNGASTPTISNLAAGTYTVTVTNSNGCTDSQTATISQPNALGNTFSGSPVSCFGGNNGELTANPDGGTPGYSFSWNTGGIAASISNLTAGTYTVTITDFNGCTLVQNTAVTQPQVLTASASGVNASCFGDADGSASSGATGGTPGYSFTWNTGANSQNIANLVAGTYTVTVTDLNACTATQTAVVGQPPALSLGMNVTHESAANANDGTAQALPGGGTPGYSYLWNIGATTQLVANLAPGTYTVTVTDNNGCTIVQNAAINSFSCAGFQVNVSGTNVNCTGNANGSATATPAGGTPGYTFAWNNGGNTGTVSNLSPGAYTVTVTDNSGCVDIESVSIVEPAALTLSINVTHESAPNTSDGSANAVAGGGTPVYAYLWNTGATTAQVSGLPPGTYTVTVTDAQGCTIAQSTTVNSAGSGGTCSALPVYALYAPSEVCGNTLFSLDADDLYPSPDVQYRWILPTGDTLSTSAPTLDLLATSTAFSGNYSVFRDSSGCVSTPVGGVPVNVLSLPPGSVAAGNDTVICTAGVVVLKAKALTQGTGAWVSLGEATVDDPAKFLTSARDLQAGANRFVWTVALGACTQAGTDTVVYFLEKPLVLRDDIYSIQQARDEVLMVVLLNDALGGLMDTVLEQVGTPVSGALTLVDSTHRFYYKAEANYRGTVQFQYTVCSPASVCGFPCDTALVTIEVLNPPFVPEGLVIEGSAENRVLTIENIDDLTVEITITDRWGDVVFQEKNYTNDDPWLGDYKRTGRYLPEGAYFYFLNAYKDGEKFGDTRSGAIHLFRQP